MPIAAHYFVGLVDGEPVAHVAVAPFFQCGYYRATRLVVMPDWQGAGIGTRFLNAVCKWHLDGNGRCGKKLPVLFHTSHPNLQPFSAVLPFGFRKAQCFIRKQERNLLLIMVARAGIAGTAGISEPYRALPIWGCRMLKLFIAGQKSFGAAVYKAVRNAGHSVTGVACPVLRPAQESRLL